MSRVKIDPKHRVWWEELADWYEEQGDTENTEYTCIQLTDDYDFWPNSYVDYDDMINLWLMLLPDYDKDPDGGYSTQPAGCYVALDRVERRQAYCHNMAEGIRKVLGDE